MTWTELVLDCGDCEEREEFKSASNVEFLLKTELVSSTALKVESEAGFDSSE